MIESFHFSGNSSLFQTELISLWIWERIALPPCFNQCCWDSISTSWFVSYYLSNSYLNLKCSRLRHYWLLLYICITSLITPYRFNSCGEWFFHLAHTPWDSLTKLHQITLLILYCVISRLVTLLKVTYTPLQVSDFLNLTLSSLIFCFNFFLLFVPEMSASFTSSNVYISYIALIWIL
jgi:hypothetical protein